MVLKLPPLGGARLARPIVLRDLEQLGDGTRLAQVLTSLSAVPTAPVLGYVAVNGSWLLLWRWLWRSGRALRSSSMALRRNISPVCSLSTDRPFQCVQRVVTQIRKSAGKHHYHRRTALPSCGTPRSAVVRGGAEGTMNPPYQAFRIENCTRQLPGVNAACAERCGRGPKTVPIDFAGEPSHASG